MRADSFMPVVMWGRGVLIGEVSLALSGREAGHPIGVVCYLAQNSMSWSGNFGERCTVGQQTADGVSMVVEPRRRQPLVARDCP